MMRRTREISDDFEIGQRELLSRLGIEVPPGASVAAISFSISADASVQPQWRIHVTYTEGTTDVPDPVRQMIPGVPGA